MSALKYDTAVTRGRRAITAQTKANWTLGDIAASVEPAYGEGTIQRLADDIGIAYKTLLDYRRVSDAYPVSNRSESSWTVHQVFAGENDRFELVTQAWTVSKARAEVDRRNAKSTDDAGTDDAGTDDAGTDDYDAKLAKARAEVTRLEGELAKARAAVTKLEADAPKAAKADAPKAATPKAAKAAKLHAVAS